MNALLDWMIRGCLYLLEIMLCMRSQEKERFHGIAKTVKVHGLVFFRGEDQYCRIETVADAQLKSSRHHTRLRLFQVVIQASNPSVNVTGTASRPNCKRES